MATKTTTLLLNNIHCPSCIQLIKSSLSNKFSLNQNQISVSILSGLVSFPSPSNAYNLNLIKQSLINDGFEIIETEEDGEIITTSTSTLKTANKNKQQDGSKINWFELKSNKEKRLKKELELQKKREEAHILSCKSCQSEGELGKGKEKQHIIEFQSKSEFTTTLMISGMTCSSCTNSLTSILSPESNPGIKSTIITLLPPLATVIHDPNLITKEKLAEEVEDGGFEAEVVSSIPIESGDDRELESQEGKGDRTVKIKVGGMFCDKCSFAINAHLESLLNDGSIKSYNPISLAHPITTLVYTPRPPLNFTLRSLRTSIESLGPFTIHTITTASTISILSAQSQARESKKIKIHLLLTLIAAIPTFLIAIVFISLLSSSHPINIYFSTPIWGQATRATVALFVITTPVQFGVGSLFYARAFKGIKNVWKRGWKERLLRWGSMDTLVALGTSAAYFASIAFMILDITASPMMSNSTGGMSGYFDSSVFLMLFILAGRYVEGISRRKTSEEVEKLGKGKAVRGLLYKGKLDQVDLLDLKHQQQQEEKENCEESDSDSTSGTRISTTIPTTIPSTSTTTDPNSIEVDFLELGDLLLIPSGSQVPLDSILLSNSPSSTFDESSLTGESLPILKHPGSEIYAGSSNLGPSAVIVKVINGPGSGMIDTITGAVREAMSRKASIERLADLITGYFVPAIVGIASFTFIVWILRGYFGHLPLEWLQDGAERGGWILFAVQFTVAVLVVSCPCGIGLSAPSSQMVGIGICGRLGIIPFGGGEAFQNASSIDVVVFDKTGTITKGEFKVSDYQIYPLENSTFDSSSASLFSILDVVEEASSHPISIGLKSFCKSQLSTLTSAIQPQLSKSEEIPGRGLKALVLLGNIEIEVFVGNELLMKDNDATYDDSVKDSIALWSSEGKSIVLVSIKPIQSLSEDPIQTISQHQVVSIFSIQDPPRPEAAYVIKQLEKKGIAVFLCTGDNLLTANSIAKSVGLSEDRVFASVLPIGKKDCIERLQNGSAEEILIKLRGKRNWWNFGTRKSKDGKAKVLFVGDGINDIVALTQSDVGVSMGTGAAIALSSSDFCLLSSNLLSLLTVLALAKATYYKILTNFAWASIFNAVLIPVAAGAFYDLGRTRLPPVYASLAMALSSISVVCNSLLLRYTFKVPKEVKDFKLEVRGQ